MDSESINWVHIIKATEWASEWGIYIYMYVCISAMRVASICKGWKWQDSGGENKNMPTTTHTPFIDISHNSNSAADSFVCL